MKKTEEWTADAIDKVKTNFIMMIGGNHDRKHSITGAQYMNQEVHRTSIHPCHDRSWSKTQDSCGLVGRNRADETHHIHADNNEERKQT